MRRRMRSANAVRMVKLVTPASAATQSAQKVVTGGIEHRPAGAVPTQPKKPPWPKARRERPAAEPVGDQALRDPHQAEDSGIAVYPKATSPRLQPTAAMTQPWAGSVARTPITIV